MRKRAVIFLLCAYLGLYGGHIALWDTPGGAPQYVFPYSAALLPQQDQQALEAGIYCPTQEEVNRLLQDYLS